MTRAVVVPAARIWAVISAGDRVERWFDWVGETVVQSALENGLRIIKMKDGTSFAEFITVNDAASRTYQYYAPAPPLPMGHVIGTMRLVAERGGGATLSWSVSFERTRAAPSDFSAILRALYTGALARIDAVATAE